MRPMATNGSSLLARRFAGISLKIWLSESDILFVFRHDDNGGCETKKFRTILPNLNCLQTLKISSSKESNAILFDKLIACAPNLQTLTLERCLVSIFVIFP